MEALREKSLKLTGFLLELLEGQGGFHIMTPTAEEERGCQMSLVVDNNGRRVFDALTDSGVVCDWREPDCIRIAPVPLYNSFLDVLKFSQIFLEQLAR